MKGALVGALMLTAMVATPAFAHRLDEYLEATTMEVSRSTLHVDMRFAPGVAVAKSVLDSIDTNGDGNVSDAERQHYAAAILRDVRVTLDGKPLQLRLVSSHFDRMNDLRHGTGEMNFAFEADVPSGGEERTLQFENRHRSAIGAYLVNTLVPDDRDIRIVSQRRNYSQSLYEMSYVQSTLTANSISAGGLVKWLVAFVGLAVVMWQGAVRFVGRESKGQTS